jgi:hypothetical protein
MIPIPFVKPAKIDKTIIPMEYYADEMEGIILKMVEGAIRWKKYGFEKLSD